MLKAVYGSLARALAPEQGTSRTLGEQLARALALVGARRVFAVPGDYVVGLCDVLMASRRVSLHTLSFEPSAALAAIGAALATRQPAAVLVTLGVGGLQVLNAVAQAYVERIPLIVISGMPGMRERVPGLGLHHQIGAGFGVQARMFAPVTAAQAVLTDNSQAAFEAVVRALAVAAVQSRPVYIEIPRDLVNMAVPGRATEPTEPDREERAEAALRAACNPAAERMLARMTAAARPVVVAGLEVARRSLGNAVMALAEDLDIPVVTTMVGRGAVDERHPRFAGVYAGPIALEPSVRELVERSDCLVILGEPSMDINMGIGLAVPAQRLIHICDQQAVIAGQVYAPVPLSVLVEVLAERARGRSGQGARYRESVPAAAHKESAQAAEYRESTQTAGQPWNTGAEHGSETGPLTTDSAMAEIARFLRAHSDMPVLADIGNPFFAAQRLTAVRLYTSGLYATMGMAVPAALGMELATGERTLALVGDGGFQMTGCELANARRLGVAPVVVVFNNRSWQTLTGFRASPELTTLADWHYAEMARAWGLVGTRATSTAELRAALENAFAAPDPALIELELAADDCSAVLSAFARALRSGYPYHGRARRP